MNKTKKTLNTHTHKKHTRMQRRRIESRRKKRGKVIRDIAKTKQTKTNKKKQH